MEREQGEGHKSAEFDPSTGTVETRDPLEQKKKAAQKSDEWREQK